MFLALLVASRAEQTENQNGKAKLVTRVYPAYEGMFGLGANPVPDLNKTAGSEPRLLSPAADGERRYDVWGYLAANGVEKNLPGSEAILLADSHALVVTASAEMQDLIKRIVFVINCCGGILKHMEVTATLWEYEDDQFADAEAKPNHLSELRKLAGNSMKLLDSQMIATKSGQRAITLIKESGAKRAPVAVPEPKPANPPANATTQLWKLDDSRGSLFEIEPTIGPDGEGVDMQVSYEARLKRPNAEPDIEVNVATNLTVMNGQDAIPYRALARGEDALARGGKVKRHALIIGARVIDIDGLTADERRKLQEQKEEQLIHKAHAGLDAPKN